MTAQSKQGNYREPDKRKSIIIRPIAVLLIFTVIVCITACLECINHWSDEYPGYQNDPNLSVVNKAYWAQRMDFPGLPNFYKVSDDLYRGAQPTAQGMKQLKELGIKTIINLRAIHSDRDDLGNTKLAYEHLNMTTLGPENEDVIRFLQIVTDSNSTPVFVHCQYGADRTGTMCAIYRIAVQGWSKDEAIAEMTGGGFGFHRIWMNLVDYIRKLDVDEIKNSAGLNE
jgi:tyrosine-protein phosphatase SIW14